MVQLILHTNSALFLMSDYTVLALPFADDLDFQSIRFVKNFNRLFCATSDSLRQFRKSACSIYFIFLLVFTHSNSLPPVHFLTSTFFSVPFLLFSSNHRDMRHCCEQLQMINETWHSTFLIQIIYFDENSKTKPKSEQWLT